MHHYTGPGTAVESNEYLRRRADGGARALAVVVDVPTRQGYDSDSREAAGRVGRAGVAIDSVDDMRVLFRGIRLGAVSVTLTAADPAGALLLLCQLVGEEQGVPARRMRGVLGTGGAGGPRVFPASAAPRPGADVLAYLRAELPGWTVRAVAAPPPDAACLPCPVLESRQRERLAKLRAWRDQDLVGEALLRVHKAAWGTDGVLPPMKDALRSGATVGEVYGTLREVWGGGAGPQGPPHRMS
ncbi:methylmalonyl-CoA mutase family protein [Streptomyces sp. NPDC101158]|uniref:methylmalonyl-CoA mutase family protein n=1 Tax=Streptomyces sp. NPDC101158 TaxID=3366117 RepID=UPI0038273761